MLDFFGFSDMQNDYEDRVVGRYEEGDVFVSTARVSDGKQPYETGVAHPEYNNDDIIIVEAYDDHAAALFGHGKWVKIMTAETLPDHLEDCQNSNIQQIASMLGDDTIFLRQSRNKM